MESRSWLSGLQDAAEQLYAAVLSLLPQVLLAAVLLGAGWLAGRFLRWLTVRLVDRLGRIRTGQAVDRAVRAAGVERVAKEVGGRVVFWIVFVFFAAAAGEVLGLSVASSGLGVLVRYLPSVLAATLIVMVGLVLGNVTRGAIGTFSTAAGVDGRVPGQLARYTIVFVAVVVALDQIGIESTLLILAAGIMLAALAGSAALAIGLGARTEVGNIIALHYVSRSYSIGQRVRVGDIDGLLAEFRVNGVVLDTAEGRVLVPAKEFSEQVSCLLGEAG
jgi:small-conductance mechanosensitive channel